MFILLLAVAAAVTGLGDRPASLTGPDPAAYAAWLADSALKLEGRGGDLCTDAVVHSLGGGELSADFYARERVRPDRAAGPPWVERLRVVGCGADRRVNLMAVRLKEGGWGVLPLPPGESLAGYRLHTDMMMSVLQSASSTRPALTCATEEMVRTFDLHDAVVLTPPESGAWSERWTVGMCGAERQIDIQFIPAGDGGTTWSIKVER